MTEREWMEKIRASAEEIEIPESISPDNMRSKLGRRRIGYARKQIAAAAILVLCGLSVFTGYRIMNHSEEDMVEEISRTANEIFTESTDNTEAVQEAEIAAEPVEKRDAGTMYIVAKNYGEVYDMLAENASSLMRGAEMAVTTGTNSAMAEAEIEDSSSQNFSSSAGMADYAIQDSVEDLLVKEASISHSETNVQTEGVEESDIIQTDGSYIYIVKDNTVQIVDIAGNTMQIAGKIYVPMNSASDQIVELYVNGDCLNLIVEREKTTLTMTQSADRGAETQEDTAVTGTADAGMIDVYYMDTDRTTELMTYDISNRANPKLSGSIEQDGYYKTSRKIGSVVYLFTEQTLEMPNTTRGTAVLEDEVKGWIPLVGGNAIAADSIYLPADGSNGNGMIISSININQPDRTIDSTMILNNYVNVYVSTESLYLYNSKYLNGGIGTEIAKFELDNGIINAVGATSAAGEVYDTFAIYEYQGKLRLLTTDWSRGENENNLYLFDEELKLTGTLTGVARGESIYAARYFGDMAYFVTYRNTDPLFAVDLSDETEPKILSELEITGFSEYLHFWGEDKLIGIGYETNPNTGRQEGIKLTMFDLSDPAELKTLGTCVIENIDYCPAFYNYKYVLADAGENMLGFAAETYGRGREGSYLLFSWEDGRFQQLLVETLADSVNTQGCRGLYAGDTFYLVNQDYIMSYDRTQEYQKKGDLEL